MSFTKITKAVSTTEVDHTDKIDRSVVIAYLLEGESITKKYSPEKFEIDSSWNEYKEDFEKRNNLSLESFCEIAKSTQDGLHDHDVDASGAHAHREGKPMAGAHIHDGTNPYGIHSHDDDDPLGGAHVHDSPNGFLGTHDHGPQNRINYLGVDNIEKSSEFKPITILKAANEMSEAGRGLAYALETVIREFDWSINFFIKRLNKALEDRTAVKLNNMFLGSLLMLKDDLKFLQYVGDEIVGIQQFTLPSMQAEAVEKLFVEANAWDIEMVNEISMLLNRVISLLKGFSMTLENPSLESFKAQVGDCLVLAIMFRSTFPQLLAFANQKDIISIEPKEIEMPTVELDISKSAEFKSEYIIKEYDITSRTVTGIILEPEVVDHQGQFIGSEAIKKAMFEYMLEKQVIGLDHETFNGEAGLDDPDYRIVECWQERGENTIINGEHIKKGSWMLTTKIFNDDAWERVEKGDLTGYSIGGRGVVDPDAEKPNEVVFR